MKSAELDILFGRTEDKLQHAVTMLQIESLHDNELISLFEKVHDDYLTYLQDVKEMCQQIWAKFDHTCILLGLLTLVLTVVFTISSIIYINDDNEHTAFIVTFVSTFWIVLYFIFLYHVDLRLRGLIIALIVGLSIMSLSLTLYIQVKHPKKLSLLMPDGPLVNQPSALQTFLGTMKRLDWLCVALLAINLLGMFSNSFVIYEDHVVSFLLITSVFLLVLSNIHSMALNSSSGGYINITSKRHTAGTTHRLKPRNQSHDIVDLGYFITSPQTVLCCIFILFSVCIRTSTYLRACREEQWQCVDSPFLRSLSTLNHGSSHPQNMRYVFSIASLIAIVSVARYYLRYCGNLNGTRPAVLVAAYTPTLSAVSIGLYWALQALPQKIYDSLPTWQIVMLPQLVYLLVFASILIVILKPLCIFVIVRNVETSVANVFVHGGDSSQIIPHLCNHIKSNWNRTSTSSDGMYYLLFMKWIILSTNYMI